MFVCGDCACGRWSLGSIDAFLVVAFGFCVRALERRRGRRRREWGKGYWCCEFVVFRVGGEVEVIVVHWLCSVL